MRLIMKIILNKMLGFISVVSLMIVLSELFYGIPINLHDYWLFHKYEKDILQKKLIVENVDFGGQRTQNTSVYGYLINDKKIKLNVTLFCKDEKNNLNKYQKYAESRTKGDTLNILYSEKIPFFELKIHKNIENSIDYFSIRKKSVLIKNIIIMLCCTSTIIVILVLTRKNGHQKLNK